MRARVLVAATVVAAAGLAATAALGGGGFQGRSEEHTSELQSRFDLVCRLLLEKKKQPKPSVCLAIFTSEPISSAGSTRCASLKLISLIGSLTSSTAFFTAYLCINSLLCSISAT